MLRSLLILSLLLAGIYGPAVECWHCVSHHADASTELDVDCADDCDCGDQVSHAHDLPMSKPDLAGERVRLSVGAVGIHAELSVAPLAPRTFEPLRNVNPQQTLQSCRR